VTENTPERARKLSPCKDTWAHGATFAFDVYEGFQGKQETAVAALDLEDAYKKVRYDLLAKILMDMEVCPWIINWISAILYERKVALRLGSWVSDQSTIAPGLPQGSPISPVLFNVYIAKISAIEIPGSGRCMQMMF